MGPGEHQVEKLRAAWGRPVNLCAHHTSRQTVRFSITACAGLLFDMYDVEGVNRIGIVIDYF